ncbi:GNAT family N-acetyltransferase [Planococcus faecalis]|uniref:N-acetyltransferase domain-containing protein n=1 Tax=Planococcus faecalis TaxID=1598147 RepID=A0ABN4XSR2_9BACL|nr:GNAT family N-acetyltransferase [Planococcus faecalis]AQU80224.1 hypothetical protein AJGP001_13485 [Planococcus faecalis]OHX51973.1 hypothetical protein BB777_03620 [Planococcus faecalis]
MKLSNKDIEIRLMNTKDLSDNKNVIIELLEDNMKLNFPTLRQFTDYAIKGFSDMVKYKKNDTAILVGAFNENGLVGFIWAHKRELFGEKRLHIGHIIVNTQIRSKGVGSRLISFLENFSESENIMKIELNTTISNENTMKFYKSKGYSTVRVQFEKELGGTSDY